MRNPDDLHQPYEYIDQVPTIITMDELPPYDRYDYDLADDNSFNKYIGNIKKKCVRGSFEYRQMVSYLRDYLDMNKCAFYLNVSNMDTTKIRIEIHHDPLSLEDICKIIYNKRSDLRESLDEEIVAKEVMYLHYDMQVGLIPLAETVHELVHNQYLFVPTTKVYGKYKEFVARYKPWMLPEQLEVLDRIESYTADYDDYYKQLLERKYIYVNLDQNKTLPTTEEVIGIVKDRLHIILNDSGQKEAQMPQKD